ncbi:MAG: CZB domain-containing protein [Candidatus Sedimenticola endophacoides]
MLNINHRETTEIIGQLNSAVHYHEEWFEKVTQQLVCRQPHPGEISRDAHRGCHFGHWYYHQAHPRLKEHPGFQAIEPLHKQMHDSAARLLSASPAQYVRG